MKYLDYIGLEYFYNKIKTYVSGLLSGINNYTINGLKISTNPSLTKANIGLGNVTNDAQVKRNEMGVASGVATLNASGKLPTAQLPELKTINGSSVVGSGNIAIDLSIYKVVSTLPMSDIDIHKIYLVANSSGPEGNVFKEYIFVDNKWEEIGTFSATVDLTPYVKKSEVETTLSSTSSNPIANKTVKNAIDNELNKVRNIGGFWQSLSSLNAEAGPFGVLEFSRNTSVGGSASITYNATGICPTEGGFVWVRVTDFTVVAGTSKYYFKARQNTTTGTPTTNVDIYVPQVVYQNGGKWALCEVMANKVLKVLINFMYLPNESIVAITNAEIDSACS